MLAHERVLFADDRQPGGHPNSSRGVLIRSAACVAAAVLAWLWGEATNAWFSRRGFPARKRSPKSLRPGRAPDGGLAVVVLGYRDAGRRANSINRWRVRAALRSLDPNATRTRLICCGGPVAGPVSEAALLAAHARHLGFADEIVLDENSRTTWGNVLALGEIAPKCWRIVIVSHPPHALKARTYLWRQRPDLAAWLEPAQDYRFGEWWWLKPAIASYGLWDLLKTGTLIAGQPKDA